MADLDWRRLDWKRAVLFVALFVAAFLFRQYLVPVVLAILTALVAVSVNHFDLRFTGIELATFSTVVTGLLFGPAAGALGGLFYVLVQMILGQQTGVYMTWVVPSYAVAGFIAGAATIPVTQIGVYLTVGMHILFFTFTALVTPKGISKYLPYAVGNTLLNAALFTTMGPALLGSVN